MEEPLNIERDVVKNGVRLDCVFEGYEYRPEREEVRSQRLAGDGSVLLIAGRNITGSISLFGSRSVKTVEGSSMP